MNPYEIEIIKVDNGFAVRLENDNCISKVFVSVEEVAEFVKQYFSKERQN